MKNIANKQFFAKHWLVGIGLTVMLLALTGILLLTVSDWNRARPWINKTVAAALDRPFAINGELHLHWRRDVANLRYHLPRPQVTATNIVIGNPNWLSGNDSADQNSPQKNFGRIGKMTVVIDPWPLLGRTVVLPLLDIEAMQLNLKRMQDGRNNWTLGKNDTDKDPAKQWRIAPGLLRVHDSWVQLDDAQRQLIMRANANSYEKGIRWTIKGTLNQMPLHGKGMAGSLLALQDKKTPYPIAFDLHAGDTHIEAKGTLTNPSQLAALDLNLKISGTSAAHLYTLTNIVLPETPPYATDGHLVGTLNAHGGTWRYEKFNGTLGSSDVHGTAVYESRSEKPPLLNAELVSQNLMLADLAPFIGADSNASKERRNAAVRQPEDKALPIEPFKTDRWDSIEAHVKVSGKKIIREAALPIENLEAKVDLVDSVLQFTPLQFGIAGGDLTATIKLDARREPVRADIEFTTRHLQLKDLFPTAESMQASLGEVNGSARLSATGNSIAALMGSADGEIGLFMDRASISKFLLEAAGLNIANVVVTKLFGDRQVQLNCAVADFTIDDGVMKSEGFIVDTEDALIDVNGNIDLGNEQLDLKVKPQSKGLRVLSLRTPLYVKGTFKNPDINLDKGVLALRGGGAIALGAVALPAALVPLIATGKAELQQDNGCIALLAHSREAATAQMATPAP